MLGVGVEGPHHTKAVGVNGRGECTSLHVLGGQVGQGPPHCARTAQGPTAAPPASPHSHPCQPEVTQPGGQCLVQQDV